ncbi:putative transcriptional regulator [uncultured delta proteobacterium]|uniref:Putative transcriptional regulator n=1 Tax=uncultured delta proteobacterium TaxID=34034 RepID=A0A212IYR6_9DELT|nr:putative transcriptional regulator [uncultured delta proteobacterium]
MPVSNEKTKPLRNQPPYTNVEALLLHLKKQFESLSPQFRLGAKYLLDNPREVPVRSMRKIATDAQVRPITLIRLARLLGFEGWQDLRECFVNGFNENATQLSSRARKLLSEPGSDRLLAAMLDAQRKNLMALSRQEAGLLGKAAALINAAPNVHVAGFRSSYPIAFSFYYLYRLFRSSVHLIEGAAGTLELELRPLEPGDSVLMVSYEPYSQEILRVAEIAHDSGCTLIALTDSLVSPIALKADCSLLFSASSPSFFPSTASALALVEILIAHLLAEKGEEAIRAITRTEGQLHETGAYLRKKS